MASQDERRPTDPVRLAPNETRPSVRMSWTNLLFLHWRVDPTVVRPLLPSELELDVFDGRAWVGLVPFRMESCRFRGVPPLPSTVDFFECNLRTYARHRDRPGVWFFSLDAQTLLPVLGGRWLWSLNYVRSRFEVSSEDGPSGRRIDYALRRMPGPWPHAHARISWRAGEPLPGSRPGTLEHFLTERYWLFTRRRGRILAGRVHHEPWPLRSAVVERIEQTVTLAAGISDDAIAGQTPVALASERVDVLGWNLRR